MIDLRIGQQDDRPRKRFRPQLTDEQAYLCRRVLMIEMRRFWPADLVAEVFSCSTALVYTESRKGYPAELDHDLAEGMARTVRETAKWWAEKQAAIRGEME